MNNSETLTHIDPVPSEAKFAKFDLCVLTPKFYGRFASHTSLRDSFEAEILSEDAEENRTAQVSNSEVFCDLLLLSSNKSLSNASHANTKGLLDQFQWLLVYLIRTPPPMGLYPRLGNPHLRTQADVRGAAAKVSIPTISLSHRMHCGPGFLDIFVLESCSLHDQAAYRRALIRIFLSNRLALGDERILHAYEVIFKILIATIAGRILWVRWLSGVIIFDAWIFGVLSIPVACILLTVWSMPGGNPITTTP